MDKFETLRKEYPIFEYNSYDINDKEDCLEITYNFNIPNLAEFHPRWIFPKAKKVINEDKKKILEKAIFNLGMVEVISYLKATCSPKLIIKSGYLTDNQVTWYKKLYTNGLGEFFYTNGIISQMNIDTFLDIDVKGFDNEKFRKTDLNTHLSGNLIPVGGGKDSAVTLEVLSGDNDINTCYIVNPREASYDCAKIAGYDDENIYCPRRYLDGKIIELNKKGFFNGHTPFSAILAFSSYISAILLEKKYIVLSNEDSANEANVKGTNINHQYSKSIEFENDFREYVKENICENGPEYFSLLRPISEWQIVRAFVKSPKYFQVFKSCNVGSKADIWCESCPKCLYVYIMLSAFLSDKDMNKIFKENMLENYSLKDIFNGLVYPDYDKPFECVGTKEEIGLSLDIVMSKMKMQNIKIPKLLEDYHENSIDLEKRIDRAKTNWNNLNNLPSDFEKKLKNYII